MILSCLQFFNDRAILAPTIESVNQINAFMCSLLLGTGVNNFTCDTVCKSSQGTDSFEDLYTTEFLNTINYLGLPTQAYSHSRFTYTVAKEY